MVVVISVWPQVVTWVSDLSALGCWEVTVNRCFNWWNQHVWPAEFGAVLLLWLWLVVVVVFEVPLVVLGCVSCPCCGTWTCRRYVRCWNVRRVCKRMRLNEPAKWTGGRILFDWWLRSLDSCAQNHLPLATVATSRTSRFVTTWPFPGIDHHNRSFLSLVLVGFQANAMTHRAIPWYHTVSRPFGRYQPP